MATRTPQGLKCDACGIYNPLNSQKCVRCRADLVVTQETLPPQPSTKPTAIARPQQPPRSVYQPNPDFPDMMMPGRSSWVGAYALALGIGAAACFGALCLRVINGSLTTTYSSIALPLAILIICFLSIRAAINLWRMRYRGWVLTLLIQVGWIIFAATTIYMTFTRFPVSQRSEFFILPDEKTLRVIGVPLLLAFGVLIIFLFFTFRIGPVFVLSGKLEDVIFELLWLVARLAI